MTSQTTRGQQEANKIAKKNNAGNKDVGNAVISVFTNEENKKSSNSNRRKLNEVLPRSG